MNTPEHDDVPPLHGVRVVTLAVNVPGPVTAARLHTLGATVIKVEPPAGDPLEAVSPAWYRELLVRQEVVRLNLKADGDRVALDDLLEQAGVLLTATRPAALDRLGLAALARGLSASRTGRRRRTPRPACRRARP